MSLAADAEGVPHILFSFLDRMDYQLARLEEERWDLERAFLALPATLQGAKQAMAFRGAERYIVFAEEIPRGSSVAVVDQRGKEESLEGIHGVLHDLDMRVGPAGRVHIMMSAEDTNRYLDGTENMGQLDPNYGLRDMAGLVEHWEIVGDHRAIEMLVHREGGLYYRTWDGKLLGP